MAIRTIITEPNKLLRQVSKPVNQVGKEEQKLMKDMLETMYALGLPFVRTSPDHGTAFDIAGKDCANPTSMIEALRLADQLSQR